MSYYKVLGLEREPFSTSPDPEFLCLCREHKAALYKLRIAVSLKRGMSVVLGDVGMGKTTLSRKLSQVLCQDKDVLFHMILNPFFKSEEQFLSRLAGLFHIPLEGELLSNLDYIEAIERYLFQKGVEEKKTVVLLIDEAQMLPEYVLEVLRILLNYETNEFKILQLILVGQMELLPTISNMPNFWDRIALKCVINPLAKDEVADIIDFRIKQAGLPLGKNLFTNEAIALMAHHTGGYPRKLSMLCHNALEHIVMHDMDRVDADVIQELIDSELKPMTFGFNGVPDVVR